MFKRISNHLFYFICSSQEKSTNNRSVIATFFLHPVKCYQKKTPMLVLLCYFECT